MVGTSAQETIRELTEALEALATIMDWESSHPKTGPAVRYARSVIAKAQAQVSS